MTARININRAIPKPVGRPTIRKGVVVSPTAKPKRAPIPRGKRSKYDWMNIHKTWEEAALAGKPMTLDQLADEFKVARSSVYNKSAKGKWTSELAFKMTNRDTIVASALQTRSELAIAKLQESFIGDEFEVRKRHALMAKGMQAKAIRRLQDIDSKDLRPSDALAMLKLGLDEERRALGLPEVYDPAKGGKSDDSHPEYKPLVQQMQNHKQVQAMGVELLKRLQKLGQPISDANILKEVGLGG